MWGGEGTGEVSRENYFLADQLGIETPPWGITAPDLSASSVTLQSPSFAKFQSLHYELIARMAQVTQNIPKGP